MTTRDRIVQSASRLFYEQGFEHTSFADVAAAVGISRGNFYHHFKSKDEMLEAVIAARVVATRRMLDDWTSAEPNAADQLARFVDLWHVNGDDIVRFGCPVGTLCGELGKLAHPAEPHAKQLFLMFRSWLGARFAALGHPGADADRLAMHLLARSQGVASVASALHDRDFIELEVAATHRWLRDHRVPSA